MVTIPHESKVDYKEKKTSIKTMALGDTVAACAVGKTKWGPLAGETIDSEKQTFTHVQSFPEFEEIFGGFGTNYDLAKYAYGFFDSGGTDLYVARVCHFTDPTDATTATAVRATVTLDATTATATGASVTGTAVAPFTLVAGGTVIVSVDGGGTDTATFDAAAAVLTSGSTGTYDFSTGGDEDLTVIVDGGYTQTLTFPDSWFSAPAAATAVEVANAINQQLVGGWAQDDTGDVKISSDKKGSGSSIQVTGGSANSLLNFSTTAVTGSGDVADIKAVTVTEAKTLIEADVSGVTVTEDASNHLVITTTDTGAAKSIQVDASSTLDGATYFGLDNTVHDGTDTSATSCLTVNGKYFGTRGNDLAVTIASPTGGEADHYDIVVYESSVVKERWYNVSQSDVETIVNDSDKGSSLISVTVEDDSNTPDTGQTSLTGGDDGLTSIDNDDYTGDSDEGTGMRAFDSMETETVFTFLCDRTGESDLVKSIEDYLGTTLNAKGLFVWNHSSGTSYSTFRTFMSSNGVKNYSEFGAGFWPWIKVPNPDKDNLGSTDTVAFPPAGFVAGCYALQSSRGDVGLSNEPAGWDQGYIKHAVSVNNEDVNKDGVRGKLYPDLVNPVRSRKGRVFVDGVLVNKVTSNFPTFAQRMVANFVAQTVLEYMDELRHRGNDDEMQQEFYDNVETFLKALTKKGAFASRNDAASWVIDLSQNTPVTQRNLEFHVGIGIATKAPFEFGYLTMGYNEEGLILEENL